MGYTTEFRGEIAIDPPLTVAELNAVKDMEYSERWRTDKSVPRGWCQWVPNKEGTAIQWNDGEKFYYAEEWMQWLITNIVCKDNERTLNGEIHAQGEEMDDKWVLAVKDNKVSRR